MNDVIEIPLTMGKVALIDADDLPLVLRRMWHTRNCDGRLYAVTNLPGRRVDKRGAVYMHRIVIGSAGNVDHINGDGLDNRRCNLRFATQSQNVANAEKHRAASSRFKGVSWSANAKKWLAQIVCGGVHFHLGYFVDERAAATAYDMAATARFGEFARVNFSQGAD